MMDSPDAHSNFPWMTNAVPPIVTLQNLRQSERAVFHSPSPPPPIQPLGPKKKKEPQSEPVVRESSSPEPFEPSAEGLEMLMRLPGFPLSSGLEDISLPANIAPEIRDKLYQNFQHYAPIIGKNAPVKVNYNKKSVSIIVTCQNLQNLTPLHWLKAGKRHLASKKTQNKNNKNTADDFGLTAEIAAFLMSQPCSYCNRAALDGGIPGNAYIAPGLGKVDDVSYYLTLKWPCNTIDRINSFLPYVDGNMTSACHSCNMMKNNLTHGAFIEHVARIYNITGHRYMYELQMRQHHQMQAFLNSHPHPPPSE